MRMFDPVTYALAKKNGSGSLPSVTSSDNGKVLGVVDGAWAASEQGKKFIVTLTPTDLDYSGTMDKTVAEINAAYEAGQEIWFDVAIASDTHVLIMATAVFLDGTVTYHGFETYFTASQGGVGILVRFYTGSTNDGTKQYYNTEVYSLTPAS